MSVIVQHEMEKIMLFKENHTPRKYGYVERVITNIILLRGSITKKSTFNRMNGKFMLLMRKKMDKTNTTKCMKIRIRRQMIKLMKCRSALPK